LGLSFTAKKVTPDSIDKATRLYSDDYDGYFISNTRTPALEKLVDGLPHCLILENNDRDLFILVAGSKPEIAPLSVLDINMILDKSNKEWMDNMTTGARHYLYPVHLSQAFIFTQSLASALYMLLFKFIAHQYDYVFRMVSSCVSDTDLSKEEFQIFRILSLLNIDSHPDAHACRLKFSLATMASSMQCPWDVSMELEDYIRKVRVVSASCRLTSSEELSLLEMYTRDTRNPHLLNRLNFLRAVVHGNEQSMGAKVRDFKGQANGTKEDGSLITKSLSRAVLGMSQVPLNYPYRPVYSCFDTYVDQTCIKDDMKNGGTSVGFFSAMSYSTPEGLIGMPALEYLQKWVDSIDVTGTSFILLYEMMTGTLDLKIRVMDNSYILAQLLLHTLSPAESNKPLYPLSVLRVLSTHPDIAAMAPKLERRSKSKLDLLKNTGILKKFGKQVYEFFLSKKNEIRWPQVSAEFQPPEYMVPPCLFDLKASDRIWTVPRVIDFSCEARILRPVVLDATPELASLTLSATDIRAFATHPLACIGLGTFCTARSRVERGQAPVPDKVPFVVQHHPHSKSHIAISNQSRLVEDVEFYSKRENSLQTPALKYFYSSDVALYMNSPQGSEIAIAKQQVQALLTALRQLQTRDNDYMFRAIDFLTASANSSNFRARQLTEDEIVKRLGHNLGQTSGREVTLWFELLIGLLCSPTGTADLQGLNPYLADIALVENMTAGVLLTVNRLAQTTRCIALANDLANLLQRLSSLKPEVAQTDEPLYRAIDSKATTLAANLTAKRFYFQPVNDSFGGLNMPAFKYDPRFLVTEFTSTMILRESQVALIGKFMEAVRAGQSVCHQMIMGAGKTTVVGPLLALLLADGKSLVVQCVPNALLEMSRGVMRERFSTIFNKAVLTFYFDRFMRVTEGLYRKMYHARETRAVVITTPTAIKSFALKFVEIMHTLDGASIETDIGKRSTGLRSLFGLTKEDVVQARQIDPAQIAELKKEAELCVRIIDIFRSGALLLDEVDLILHPLKSELNWPIGGKRPLDFTRSRDGNEKNDGLRWKIPFHLLDAIFYCSEGRMTVNFKDSREAVLLLDKIKQVIDDGHAKKLVQKTPHIVLLDRGYYNQLLKPLMARWMLIWMRHQSVRVADRVILAFLASGPDADPETTRAIHNNLSDDQIKMLNLSRDWLESCLPHVLSKIDRVTFGLLNPKDLAEATERNPRMPKTRKLLAVPFVGKDVPSRESEFSHPDVVIGLTILAYRYEGLRATDFIYVLSALREKLMEEEFGPMAQRESWLMFAKWVEVAGGHVRGLKKKGAKVESAPGNASPIPAPSAAGESTEVDDEILPLHLLDLRDPEMINDLYKILGRQAIVVEHYLNSFVFPETMEHQVLKLAANGQDLGGALLFERRLGFSGTPSDLLPVEMGRCIYEQGDTAQMLHYLTSPTIVSFDVMEPGWTVPSLLKYIGQSSFNALIDTGALITGLDNLGVARYLLENGLPNMDGVVFLDSKDRKMILCRSGWKVVKLSQCKIPLDKRFTFYDQVRSTVLLQRDDDGISLSDAPRIGPFFTCRCTPLVWISNSPFQQKLLSH